MMKYRIGQKAEKLEILNLSLSYNTIVTFDRF